MPIEGFDYKEFANMLATQAGELIPAEFEQFQKDYIVKTLVNFTNLAGEAISNDQEANFNADQAVLLTQIIAEWSFHKSVDLIRSGIQPEYWDGVMQKIAFTIFEVGKQSIRQNLPQEQILSLIEHHVKQTFEDALDELEKKGIIDEGLKEAAAKQSNLDAMMEEMSEEEIQKQQEAAQQAVDATVQPSPVPQQQFPEPVPRAQVSSKFLKLTSVALLLKTLSQDKVHTILNKFNPQDAEAVVQYMQMPDLETQIDIDTAINYLREIKAVTPKLTELTPHNLMRRIQIALKGKSEEDIELLVRKERLNVKKFIFNAYQGEYFEIPPKVANIVAQYIECSV